MKPNSLLLKHFDGIKSGLGRDEIFIDFTGLPRGLIAFDGLNGMGKTTILDNMQPYRLMPSRASSYSADAFSFYDHTYGEAKKEFLFDMTGRQYKQVLTIDNERRKQECYLYVQENGRWRALNPDGGTRTYDRVIEEVMGTPKMFFTSVFRCQDAPTISESSKKDMKEVFAELLNSEGLLALGKKATEVSAKLIERIQSLRREAEPLQKTASRKETADKELKEAIADLSFLSREIEALEEKKKEKDRELATIDAALALRADKAKAKERLLNEAAQKRTRLGEIEEGVSARKAEYEKRAAALQEKIDKLADAVEAVRELVDAGGSEEVLAETVKNLDASIALCDARYVKTAKRLAEQAECDRLLKKSEMGLQRIRTDRDHAIAMAETSLQEMRQKAARLKSAPCSEAEGDFSSVCPFLEDARAASMAIAVKEEHLAALRTSADPEEERLAAEAEDLKKKCEERPAIEAEAKDALSLKEGLEKKKTEVDDKLQAARKHVAALVEKGLAEKELPERRVELSALSTERDRWLADCGREKARISKEIEAVEQEALAIVLDDELPKKREELAGEVEQIGPSIEDQRWTEGELEKVPASSKNPSGRFVGGE